MADHLVGEVPQAQGDRWIPDPKGRIVVPAPLARMLDCDPTIFDHLQDKFQSRLQEKAQGFMAVIDQMHKSVQVVQRASSDGDMPQGDLLYEATRQMRHR